MPGVRYYRCLRCSNRVISLRSLFRHLHSVHRHESNWMCGLSGCMKTFQLFTSYKKHVYRHHTNLFEKKTTHTEEVLLREAQSAQAAQSDGGAPSDVDAAETDFDRMELLGLQERMAEEGDDPNPKSSDYVKQLALLILKWKEHRRLPESTLNKIANDVIFYIQAIFEDERLQSIDKDAGKVNELLSELQLDQLLTRGRRMTYWKAHFPYIEPCSVTLRINSNGKADTMTYVPLCSVLKLILEHPTWSGDFNSYMKLDDHMCSVFDGSAFSEHVYFAGDSSKMCLQLYSDEFEVCNPLGSKRGKQKLTAVYFSVLNFGAKFRSAHAGIHLALLVKDKHVATYGLPKIIAPLLEDVSTLENEGIVANGEVAKGSVFIMTGDNLSSHRMGGFQCSFSHGRICRFCMALRHEIKHKHDETDFALRTPAGHQHHKSMLNAGLSTGSLYGVQKACAITSQGFDPTQHLPPDVMHDVLEGVIPFALKHIIAYLIAQGFFSLRQLNECILRWDYDHCDVRNKPEPLP
ncbi:uncharacterized protein LOC115310671 [Ixodes scapularis]|uniref:uncharacterized protein LOC115310671 n=1 Tax=Ixodes scapularis TaxID=6945 RepID=UPI001A9ED103|nr:uncharacterized protein LOC115310671 [Ixodes scapularis]